MQIASTATTLFLFQMAMLFWNAQGNEEVKEHSD